MQQVSDAQESWVKFHFLTHNLYICFKNRHLFSFPHLPGRNDHKQSFAKFPVHLWEEGKREGRWGRGLNYHKAASFGLARESHKNLPEDNLPEGLTHCSLFSHALQSPCSWYKHCVHMFSDAYSCELFLWMGLKDPINHTALSSGL